MILALLVVVAGCEKSSPPAVSKSGPSTQTAQALPPLPRLEGQLTVVTPIIPKRPTHITIDPSSNIYYLQETDDTRDTLFVVNSGDISNATPLSARAVLDAIDEKGAGNITTIAAGADGNVYFFFIGGTSKKTTACLGRFETRSGLIHILVREDQLAKISGMGLSLALARGTIIATGKVVWLWLHHSDSSALFQMRLSDMPSDGELLLPQPVQLRSRDGTLDMTRGDIELASGAGDSMLIQDLWSAALWKVDVTGAADVVVSLVGLPRLLSLPGESAIGDIAMFAASSEAIEPRVDQRVVPVDLETHYPSLLVLRDKKISPVPRDDLHADISFPLYEMQLQQILYEQGRDAWVGYDAASGQIVRMRLALRRVR